MAFTVADDHRTSCQGSRRIGAPAVL